MKIYGSYHPKMYNLQVAIPFLLYCLYHYMFVMQNPLLLFLNSVDMSGSGNVYGYICYRPLNISYQALNVGLWPKIEGFCNLHAKLLVIFLLYNVFSSIDVQTIQFFLTRSILICL